MRALPEGGRGSGGTPLGWEIQGTKWAFGVKLRDPCLGRGLREDPTPVPPCWNLKAWDLPGWLSPVWGQGSGEVMMGARVGGRVLSGPSVARGALGVPWQPPGKAASPFPGAQRAGGRGRRGPRVLFGRRAVRIPSARRLSRRPLGQGNKAPFSSGERHQASCVQLCAPWEPPLARWPLRLPGDEGACGPPHP